MIAAILTALAGAILGLPTLRLRGDYIAIVTLAFGEIIGRIAINGDDESFGIGHFNADQRPPRHHAGRQDRPPVRPALHHAEPETLVLAALGMALVVLFVNFRLRDSRLGRAWIAIREDEVAAAAWASRSSRRSSGLRHRRGVRRGVGRVPRLLPQPVNADQFQFSFSIFVLAMIILGGLGSIWGVVLGAIALSFINTYLIPDVLNNVPGKLGLDFDLTQLSFGIFGFLLVIMMILRPQGLLPERRRTARAHRGRRDRRGALEVRA